MPAACTNAGTPRTTTPPVAALAAGTRTATAPAGVSNVSAGSSRGPADTRPCSTAAAAAATTPGSANRG